VKHSIVPEIVQEHRVTNNGTTFVVGIFNFLPSNVLALARQSLLTSLNAPKIAGQEKGPERMFRAFSSMIVPCLTSCVGLRPEKIFRQ